jgi:hypothetical protein
MGLAAAYHATGAGHHVTVLEAGPEAGGKVARLDLSNPSTERFYHFICTGDRPRVCCLVFLLRGSVTNHLSVDITEPDIPLAGIIEFSNLRPVDGHVVYVPYYNADRS